MDNEQSIDINKFKEIYEDGKLELPSGNIYVFTKLNHKQRLKVFTRFQDFESKGLMFFDPDSESFKVVEKIIEDHVVVNQLQLSKSPKHWEDNANEFFTFYTYAMGAISYPFLPVKR